MAEVKLDSSRTHFLGRIDKDRYLSLLQVSAAHIYLTAPFVLSWSALEAMSTGCLMIASDTPPVTEFIRHDENGLTCDFDDDEALAGLIGQALDNPDLCGPLRQEARRTIAGRWSLQGALQAHEQLIREVLAPGQAR
jgi:glycosyltransferase involved in cell wall biosynthesis